MRIFERSLSRRLAPLFAAMAMCLMLGWLAGCGGGGNSKLSQANLDKLQKDMSTAEVKSILGEPTESKTEPIPIVGGTKTTYVYSDQENRVVVVFKNDNLQTKEGRFSDHP